MTTVSNAEWLILSTGRTGSLGSQLPDEVLPLLSRLESRVDMRVDEIQKLSVPGKKLAIIHCAALTSVNECEKNSALAYSLNVEGSVAWFEAAEQAGASRFIFISTAHVYRPPVDRKPLDIDAPVEPLSIYAKSKYDAEVKLLERARGSKTALSIARIFSLLSPKIRPGFLQYSLIERAKSGDYSPIPGFGLTRDFVDARKVGKTLVRLAKSESFPGLVNICSGIPKTVGELAAEIFLEHGADPSRLTGASERPTDIRFLVGIPSVF